MEVKAGATDAVLVVFDCALVCANSAASCACSTDRDVPDAALEVAASVDCVAPPAPTTVIVCVVVVLSPNAPTVPLIVSTWTPASLPCGNHEKRPDVVMLLFDTDEPVKLSLTLYAVGA